MKRKSGYYWVNYDNHHIIALYDESGDNWQICGSNYLFFSWRFSWIDECEIKLNGD